MGRETDRLDRLNERAETLDLLEDERDDPRLVRRPSTWAVTMSIATEATIGHHHQRFGWADMTDLLARVFRSSAAKSRGNNSRLLNINPY